MNSAWFVETLWAYSVQIALIVSGAAVCWALSPYRKSRDSSVFWQFVLGTAILAPWLLANWSPESVSSFGPAQIHVAFGAVVDEADATSSFVWLIPVVVVGGIVLRLTWLLIGLFRLRRLRIHGSGVSPITRRLADELGASIGVKPRLSTSTKIAGPATYGVLNPVVMLPTGFSEFDEITQRGVLSHELIHARRRDWLWMIVEEWVQATFWFHPGVWWLVRRVRLARECEVDFEAASLCRSRQDYIDTLLILAEARCHTHDAPAMGFSAKPALEQRLSALMRKEVFMSKNRRLMLSTVLSFAVAGAAWVGGHAYPLQAAPQAKSQPAAAKRIQVDGSTQSKRATEKVRPVYPREARAQRVQGTVTFAAIIDTSGQIAKLDVIEGHPLLIPSALEAVKHWEYEVTKVEGELVEVETVIEVNYTLTK